MDPAVVDKADRERLAFGQAVAMGASCEPPGGEPDLPDVTKALRELDKDLFVVVEQDMYPAPFNKPVFPKQLDEFENICLTNYLERLTQSDAAMIALEKQVLDRPEPTVLMHFGDHQPSFEGVINNMNKILPADWGPNDHWATYYTIKANYPEDSLKRPQPKGK